jgi:cytochrome oxidase assembly protein ShyY1|tara:strand:- start:368 stop:592 length:225 start_codon:yes stop_codon:yes gene_type:complete
MQSPLERFKDKIILILASGMITILLSLAGWTLYTVYKNSSVIEALSSKKQTDAKQWENIKDLLKDVSRLKTFHE